jgi:c-di-GMP-binding flagellar brake protein YcgR
MNESEKRKMERFDLKLPAKLYWSRKDNEKASIELITRDISAGGAYLPTDTPLPQGTEVKMNLILKFDRFHEFKRRQSHIDVSGFVIRTDHQGMAICFDREYKISPH